MKIITLCLLCAALSPAVQIIQRGSVSKGGAAFRYETRVEPPIVGQPVEFSGGGIQADARFHRYLLDSATRRYTGYDLTIKTQPDGKLILTFGDLSVPAQELGLKGDWTRIPAHINPAPRAVNRGDEIAVDVFTSSGWKIVEHLFFDATPGESPARDFTIKDAPLIVASPRILLNNSLLESMQTDVSGEAVYVYVPGHGRYTMSLVPHPELGFVKAGEVRGSRLSFRIGNDTWILDCRNPVAPGGGAFNLYVNADSVWRPPAEPDLYRLGAGSHAR